MSFGSPRSSRNSAHCTQMRCRRIPARQNHESEQIEYWNRVWMWSVCGRVPPRSPNYSSKVSRSSCACLSSFCLSSTSFLVLCTRQPQTRLQDARSHQWISMTTSRDVGTLALRSHSSSFACPSSTTSVMTFRTLDKIACTQLI